MGCRPGQWCILEVAMNSIIKAAIYVIGALVGIAALITAALYDWENKEPGETGRGSGPGVNDQGKNVS